MVYYIVVDDNIKREKIRKKIVSVDKTARIYMQESIKKINEDTIIKADLVICENQNDIIKKLKRYNKTILIYLPALEDNHSFSKSNLIIEKDMDNKNIESSDAFRRKKLISLITIIVLVIFIICSASVKVYEKVFVEKRKNELLQMEKTKAAKENEMISNGETEKDMKKENIIFLGDSITEGYDLEKYYSDLPCINSGVSGYRTDDIIKHMEDFVYIYNPTKVILLIGTNDIQVNEYTNEELVAKIEKIVKLIKKNRPKSDIYVESIYPINNESSNEKINLDMVGIRENARIREINKLIKTMCKKNKIYYISLFDDLVDEKGDLNIDYTRDGLHMSEEGYEVITKTIKDILKIA